MREKTAIRISMEMWEFLKDNPDKSKWEFPKYIKYKIKKMIAECSCCEFYRGCGNCPVKDCFEEGSPFLKWDDESNRKRNATIIYNRLKKYYDSKWR